MKGIDPRIACHKLNINLSIQPKQQRHCPLNLERYEALNREMQKLLRNRFI